MRASSMDKHIYFQDQEEPMTKQQKAEQRKMLQTANK